MTKLKVEIPKLYFEFEPAHNIKILQIGCGGTGSLLVPNLARFIASNNFGEKDYNVDYVLVDGDKVEKKNVVRQNFLNSDVGQYKSEVLAKRYSSAFGISVTSVDCYIKSSNELNKLCSDGSTIIISCVDNNKTRKIIHDWYCENCRGYHTLLWIDSGNEQLGGQVFLTGEISGKGIWTDIIKAHPEIALAEDKLPTELSCAERITNNEQSLAVNLTASTVIFNVVSALLREEKIFYTEISFTLGNGFKKKFLDDWKETVKR